MNENENKLLLKQCETGSGGPLESNDEKVAASRRRLLRAGVKVAPVVLATLASRPSLACHCVVPSAWGSINAGFGGNDQDMGAVKLEGSLLRQHGAKVKAGWSTYTFTNWQTTNGGCWNELIGKLGAIYPTSLLSGLSTSGAKNERKRLYLQGRYSTNAIPAVSVKQLCGWIGSPVPKGYGDFKPYEVIDVEGFAGAILVAELNIKLGKVHPDCIRTATNPNIVVSMASGSYQPEGLIEIWGEQQIADYLHYNWLARR